MNIPVVSIHQDEVVAVSLDVASYFGKRHSDVLRAIDNLDCPDDFTERNFAFCFQNNELQNGKPQRFYRMTKDGFTLMIMGFTGKAALKFKSVISIKTIKFWLFKQAQVQRIPMNA